MRMSKHSLRLYATGLSACALLACGKPGTPNTPGTGGDEDPVVTVEGCREQLASRQEELRAENVDVASWSIDDAPQMADPGLTERQIPDTHRQYDGKYRPLTNHPGCSTADLYYDKSNTRELNPKTPTPYIDGNNDGKWTDRNDYGGPNKAPSHIDGDVAKIDGYPCAAKQYTQPNPDTSKPIVILVHGNSTRPHTWERFLLPPGTQISATTEKVSISPDTEVREQLAESLIAARYQVLAVDFRTDLVATVDPSGLGAGENAAGNIDHGWATPILQSLVKAVMKNNPGRKVALVGHSLGVTVVRDALRRLYVEHTKGVAGAINPFPQLSHVILGSGANHGVSTYDAGLCTNNFTMRGTIVCEMGSRSNYVQTNFHKPLNGPKDLFATPCADGDYAFGKTGQCGGNVVKYFTITMTDITQGSNYQDFYVSESASRIDMPGCVVNKLTTLSDYDTSGYFNKGFIANHFGSLRSSAGLRLAMNYLAR
ncbi:alpha/beta hydrolase [Archangium violaceum]|uniref:esterase/lipase family protein n=1 Tax=Archangium violaceum TaxID=83451 RepID=UPI0019515773|nr:alpha/beta hydrolase [Archangium violaceum]QRN99021.1 alpha/beta hydrolase [Archangium violaceum]